MNDSVQVEYNSEYELIRKPKPRRPKTQTNRLAIRLGLGIFYLMYMLFLVIVTIVTMYTFPSVGENTNIVLKLLYIVMVAYALWRVRLVPGLVTQIIWVMIILTGYGAIGFFLIDLIANRDRNIVKQKRIMG